MATDLHEGIGRDTRIFRIDRKADKGGSGLQRPQKFTSIIIYR